MRTTVGRVKGLIISAPSSGCGKTILTLGLLRHLSKMGVQISSAKVGPDYIDPAFHAKATGRPCYNLDPWSMRRPLLQYAAANGSDDTIVICEGVMGLFDGGVMETGSTADLAQITGWATILVVDASSQGASVGALLRGFATHRNAFSPVAVIFNRIGSQRHKKILREAAESAVPNMKILGFVPKVDDLNLPERHLGLIQAIEHINLNNFLDVSASIVAEHIDIDELLKLAQPLKFADVTQQTPIAPLGQKIAIAKDKAFSFQYQLVFDGWKRNGAELSFFSPLDDQSPSEDTDAVYLSGGYPELYCRKLASCNNFMSGLRKAANRGSVIYGECGGYMVMGEGLVDAEGYRHAMAGLLPVETSFAQQKLHLGYREVRLSDHAANDSGGILGGIGQRFRGHEFHYATIIDQDKSAPLFDVCDATKKDLGSVGHFKGRIMGSFIHLIDRMDSNYE